MSEPVAPSGSGMGRRFVRGALYVGVANWASYVVNFATAIVVARILGPEAFGLYAFVVAVNEFVSIVNGLAVAPALVQSRQESDALYDTGYAISFAQALVGLLASLALAPLLAAHRAPEAGWFIVLLGLTRFPVLLVDVVMARLDRNLHYGMIAVIQLTTRSIPSLACLGLAIAGWGAWSLVLRDLMVGFLPLVVAHLWSGWWFRGNVRREAARAILGYSGPMFLARMLDIFMGRFDRLVVGWLFGNRVIGLYHQSRFIADAGILATTPVSRVTFNLYARLQEEPERLGRAFALVNYFLVRIFAAAGLVLSVAPTESLRLLLGEEWVDAAPVLRILGFYVAAATLLQNMQILLYARGAMFGSIRMRAIQLGVLLPGVLGAGWLGSLEGVALSLLASTLLATGVGWAMSRDVVRGSGTGIFAAPGVVLLATAAVFWALRPLTAALPFWSVPFLPPLVFAALLALVERRRLLEQVGVLRSQFGRTGA